MTAKQLIAYYRACHYWLDGLRKATPCYRAKEVGVEYTADERTKLHLAYQQLDAAQKIFDEIWSKRIGDQVTREVRIGEKS